MAVQMSRKEFYEKYGDVQVTFSSYYEFTFTYAAKLPDGKWLTVDYGGSSDDIYQHECSVDDVERIVSLQPYAGVVYEGREEVEYFYDY